MKNKTLLALITALLILLYVYTAASKLLSFEEFQMQMRMQVLPVWLKDQLIWTLSPAELLIALLLFMPFTRETGLWLSVILLLAFTLYIGLALSNVFARVPCSCGGVLRSMGWNFHFGFNLFFLLSNIFAIVLSVRERRNLSS